jgi:hypothetical protein
MTSGESPTYCHVAAMNQQQPVGLFICRVNIMIRGLNAAQTTIKNAPILYLRKKAHAES